MADFFASKEITFMEALRTEGTDLTNQAHDELTTLLASLDTVTEEARDAVAFMLAAEAKVTALMGLVAWTIDELQDPPQEKWGQNITEQAEIDRILAKLRAAIDDAGEK